MDVRSVLVISLKALTRSISMFLDPFPSFVPQTFFPSDARYPLEGSIYLPDKVTRWYSGRVGDGLEMRDHLCHPRYELTVPSTLFGTDLCLEPFCLKVALIRSRSVFASPLFQKVVFRATRESVANLLTPLSSEQDEDRLASFLPGLPDQVDPIDPRHQIVRYHRIVLYMVKLIERYLTRTCHLDRQVTFLTQNAPGYLLDHLIIIYEENLKRSFHP